jgi:hypothetical protein
MEGPMKLEEKDKLNKCLEILESSNLGLSLVWLWTWDIIKYNMNDDEFKCTVTEEEMWIHLCNAVGEGRGFSLEYGADQIWEDVREWMIDSGYLLEPEEEDVD